MTSRAGEVVLAFALMLALAPLTRASENDIHRAVDAFVGAMTSNDLGRYEAIADIPVSRDEFWYVRELVETSRCVDIHSYRIAIEKNDGAQATVILDVDGSRWTRGALNRRMPVPGSWVLEIVCAAKACRIHSATTRERVVARLVVSAPESEREQLVAAAALDEAVLAPVLADEAFAVKSPDGQEKKKRILEVITRARELARRSGDPAAESECVRNMSKLCRHHGDDGIPLAKEALDIAVRSGDPDAIAAATYTLGLARRRRNDIAGAIEDLRIASSTLDQLRDPRVGLDPLAMKAYLEIQYGLLRDGLRTAYQLREEAHHYGWIHGEGLAARRLARIHYMLGSTEMARTYWASAYLKAVESRDAIGQTYMLNNMAACDFLAHDFDRAIQGFRRAIASVRPGFADSDLAGIRSGLVSALLATGRIPEADRELNEMTELARRSGDTATIIRALTTQSETRLAQGRLREALAAAEDALSRPYVQPMGSESLVWPAASAGARSLRRLGRTTEAIAWLRRAIADIEEHRSRISAGDDVASRYYDDKLDPYAELAELLVRRGDAAEALQLSERIRARALVAILGQGRIDVSASMTKSETERERDLNARLAELNHKLLEKPSSEDSPALTASRDALRLELDRFREELFVARPELRLRRPLDAGTIAVPEELRDTVVIEYLVREHGVIVLTTRRGQRGNAITTGVFVPISKRRLEASANALLRAFRARDAGYRDRARRLYDLLLLPVEQEMRARRRVCVIPDGVLWRLPFHALIDRSGRHVLERTALFYAPSLRTLALAAGPSPDENLRQLLAFGDPKLSKKAAADAVAFQRDANVGALPDAADEVQAIHRFYPSDAAKVLVGAEASESAFKREAGRYRVLHIAAHGLFDESAPMYSALLLSGSEDGSEDGFLEAREIADLQLNSEIAVLSACDTARGRYGAGEGLIGMSWALQAAGCPTAIVSQWEASSKPTARLMIAFHRNLLGGATKSDALRKAALELMKDPRHAHPFYWAPFVLVGAP